MPKLKTPKKRDFTTAEHYVECESCGPKIGKQINWSYVRGGGSCLSCVCAGRPSKLTEVRLTQE